MISRCQKWLLTWPAVAFFDRRNFSEGDGGLPVHPPKLSAVLIFRNGPTATADC